MQEKINQLTWVFLRNYKLLQRLLVGQLSILGQAQNFWIAKTVQSSLLIPSYMPFRAVTREDGDMPRIRLMLARLPETASQDSRRTVGDGENDVDTR